MNFLLFLRTVFDEEPEATCVQVHCIHTRLLTDLSSCPGGSS